MTNSVPHSGDYSTPEALHDIMETAWLTLVGDQHKVAAQADEMERIATRRLLIEEEEQV